MNLTYLKFNLYYFFYHIWYNLKNEYLGNTNRIKFQPGYQIQYLTDGLLHRTNGPAVDWGTGEVWYYRGRPHRYYGPQGGLRFDSWFLHGDWIK